MVHEPVLAVAEEGAVFGLGACPEPPGGDDARSMLPSAVLFERVEKTGLATGLAIVREATVPLVSEAWRSGGACVPWVRTTPRDPARFRECMTRASTIGALRGSRDVYRVLEPVMAERACELFVVLPLDGKRRVQAVSEISRGGRDSAAVSVPDTIRIVLGHSSTMAIVAHNHPTGRVAPSAIDRETTAELARAFRHVNVTLLDHVIVGRDAFWSFADHDLLPLKD
jgi:hypothetical protein